MSSLYAKRAYEDFDEIRFFLVILILFLSCIASSSSFLVEFRWSSLWNSHKNNVSKSIWSACFSSALLRQWSFEVVIKWLKSALSMTSWIIVEKIHPNKNGKSIDEAMIPYYSQNNNKQRMQQARASWIQTKDIDWIIYICYTIRSLLWRKFWSCLSRTSWDYPKNCAALCEALPLENAQHLYMDNYFTSFRIVWRVTT